MSDKRFVTIVRAGVGSLHQTWLARAGSRSCDIIVRYFGDDPGRGIAALERVALNHTHPIDTSNDRTLRESGRSPRVERRALCKTHDIDPKIVTHHAIDRNGRPLTAGRSHHLSDLRLFLSSVAATRQSPHCGRIVRRMCKFITRPLTQTPYRLADLNATSL